MTRIGSYKFVENKKIKLTYDYELFVGSGKEQDMAVDLQDNKLTMYDPKYPDAVTTLDRSDCQPK